LGLNGELIPAAIEKNDPFHITFIIWSGSSVYDNLFRAKNSLFACRPEDWPQSIKGKLLPEDKATIAPAPVV
jgi:hypothetical protein